MGLGNVGKEVHGFFYGHIQHFGNVFIFVFHLQGFPIVSGSLADIALHIDIGQKVHGNHIHPLPAAGFTAPPFDIKGKLPRFVASGFGGGSQSKGLANHIKHPCVGSGIGTGRASNGRLIDDDEFIQHR